MRVFALHKQKHFTREVNNYAGRLENNRIETFEEDKPGLNPFLLSATVRQSSFCQQATELYRSNRKSSFHVKNQEKQLEDRFWSLLFVTQLTDSPKLVNIDSPQ